MEKKSKKPKKKDRKTFKLFRRAGLLFSHIPGLLLVFYGWRLVAQWYFNHVPALGVDLFNTVTYATYIAENYIPRIMAWKYIWWSGHPLVGEYPVLHAYLIAPLAGWLGGVTAVQAYMLGVLGVFFLFCYLLFYEISRNQGLSSWLTVLGIFSIGVYGALVWGGSLPYFGTQTFYPIAIYLLVKYLKGRKLKYLLLSGAAAGASFFGHPQVPVIYIIPTSAMLILFWSRKGEKFFSKKKLVNLGVFLGIALLVSYPEMQARTGVGFLVLPFWILQYLLGFLNSNLASLIPVAKPSGSEMSESPGPSQTQLDILKVQRERIFLLLREVNYLFYILLAVLLIAGVLLLVFSKKRKLILRSIVYSLPLGFYVLYIFLYSRGISFFHGGWYRVFWSFPMLIGILAAWQWRSMVLFFKGWMPKFWLRVGFAVITLVFLIGSAWTLLQSPEPFFTKLDTPKLAFSEASSAYPMILNYLYRPEGQEWLKERLVPDWLPADSREYRMYEADAQVNIWWNSFFKMPVQRGYIDPPIGTERRGGYFWLDIALTADQLVKVFETPVEIAKQNALFLLDWFGIRYIETGHASASYMPISSYLLEEDIFQRQEELRFTDRDSLIRYYMGLEQAPLRAVRLPQILVVGKASEYDTTLKALSPSPGRVVNHNRAVVFLNLDGSLNLQLPQVFLDQGPETIGDLDRERLFLYDGLLVYEDPYYLDGQSENSYGIIEEFVSRGKNLMLVSSNQGFDVEESSGQKEALVSGVYPILRAGEAQAGESWGLEFSVDERFSEIDTEQFGRPVFVRSTPEGEKEERAWNYSYSATGKVRKGGEILAKSGEQLVMAEKNYGEGRVLWSGIDFALHADQHDNREERELFSRLFKRQFLENEPAQPSYEVESLFPNEFKISFNGEANAVLWVNEPRANWTATYGEGREAELEWIRFDGDREGMLIDPAQIIRFEDGPYEYLFKYQGQQTLNFYELKEDYYSPILHPTNAKVIGVVGDDYSYETFFRTLGMYNANSKVVIPLKINKPIDSLSRDELELFDALICYGYEYKYHANAWNMLEAWVKDGGVLFLETGSTVAESDTESRRYADDELPAVFPMKATVQKQMGSEWEARISESEFMKGVKEERLGPLLIDGEEWRLSVPSKDSLREGAQVLLTQRETPVLIKRELGKGVVLWSGMNLFYHATVHKSREEARIMVNFLNELLELKRTKIPNDYQVNRVSAQKAEIVTIPARGVIFREQNYSWNARLVYPRKSGLKIYPTGPTYHGYMYVFLPQSREGEKMKVVFSYRGISKDIFYNITALVTILVVVDYSFLGGRVFIRWMRPVSKRLGKRTKKWWEKEDEY